MRAPKSIRSLTDEDMDTISTPGLMVSSSVLAVFSALMENLNGQAFGGFEDPTDIFLGFPEALGRLRESVTASKPTLQIHVTSAKHFVVAFWRPESSTVMLLDSLGLRPTKDLRTQLFKCYELGGPVTVYVPRLQKQDRGSNNCAFFCAAYMTDVVSYQTDGIAEAIYIDGQEQRKWFCECLLQATPFMCPRINQRRTRFLMTNPPLSEFICSG